MLGKNIAYCNACANALLGANISLTQTPVRDLTEKVRYGKSDTVAFDAAAEIQIKQRLLGFDRRAALITEELGQSLLSSWPVFSDFENHPAVFLCDPADRSDSLVKFLEKLQQSQVHSSVKFGEFVGGDNFEAWESVGQSPASITGAFTAISCVRQGQVIFSVLLNYITQEVIVAAPDGVKALKLGDYRKLKGRVLTFEEIMADGRSIEFPAIHPTSAWDNFKFFTAFMGSARKKGYAENISDSNILSEEERNDFLRDREPGGPARILYLSDLQPKDSPMGFILANGEKITEWIHWLPFIRFSRRGADRSLRLFEVFQDRPWTKEGVLMATSETYSVFQRIRDSLAFDINFLRRFPNPSQYRSTLIVAPSNNEWISQLTQQKRYREIVFDATDHSI